MEINVTRFAAVLRKIKPGLHKIVCGQVTECLAEGRVKVYKAQ